MSELEVIAAVLLRYIYRKPYLWANREDDLVVLDALLVRDVPGGSYQIIMLAGVLS